MNWHYYNGQQQVGPVSEEQLLQLKASGAITGETLVWREGMANWGRFADVGPAVAAGAPPPMAAPPVMGQAMPGYAFCSECGQSFHQDEMIRHGASYVCASCKPVFLQKVREGANTGGRRGFGVTEAQVRERDYQHDVGEYLSQSWALFKSDSGLIIGASLLVGFCWAVANFMPYIGSITGLVFSGPLLGGLFIFFLKKVRNQPATIGDAFGGFSGKFGQLLLGHLIPSLLAAVALILPMIFIFAGLFIMMGQRGGGNPALSPVIMIGLFLLLPAICVMIYYQYCWFFALWLVADKNMSFWPAMSLSRAVVRKHWWYTLWIGIVIGLISFAGMLACGVGLIVAGPVGVGVMAYSYEKLFGDMQPAA